MNDLVQTELYSLNRRSRSVALSEGKTTLVSEFEGSVCCLRALRDGRWALVINPEINESNRVTLQKEALEMAQLFSADLGRRFHTPDQRELALVAWDSGLFNRSVSELEGILKGLEQTMLSFDKRVSKVLKLHFQEELKVKKIENSLGVNVSSTSTAVSVHAEILVCEGHVIESGWDHVQARFIRQLDLKSWAESVVADAVQSLGAKPISSGKYRVIIHPKVGAQLLSLLSHAFSAQAVQMGRSFLGGYRNRQVASNLISIKDDPVLASGVASDSVDDEGVMSQPLDMVNEGVLMNYFYDLCCAAKEGCDSNGHGIKLSIGAHPSPQPTNLYVVPGATPMQDLMTHQEPTFLLKDVMGLHMADPVTGEFSLGASGVLLKSGRVLQSVRGVTIAGTIKDVFERVDAVGRELVWRGGFGVPYLSVSSMMVAGT